MIGTIELYANNLSAFYLLIGQTIQPNVCLIGKNILGNVESNSAHMPIQWAIGIPPYIGMRFPAMISHF